MKLNFELEQKAKSSGSDKYKCKEINNFLINNPDLFYYIKRNYITIIKPLLWDTVISMDKNLNLILEINIDEFIKNIYINTEEINMIIGLQKFQIVSRINFIFDGEFDYQQEDCVWDLISFFPIQKVFLNF